MSQPQHPQQPQATATMPAPQQPGVLPVPPITMPLCTRVWAASPWTDPKAKLVAGEPVLWEWNKPHPFVPAFKVVRMYVVPGGAVEVFSTDGGETGVRHTLPWHLISLIEEAMDAKTFIEEMTAAEEGDDEEEEEEEEEEEPAELTAASAHDPANLVPITSNGGQG